MATSVKSSEIFGAEVQYFRLDPRHWERVIGQLAGAGLRNLSTYIQWGTHMVGPPDKDHPAGHFDFEGKTDPRLNLVRFLDLVREAGLLLNFRCGPFCCNEAVYGGQPQFLICGDHDWMVWNHKNEPTQGYWIPRKEGLQPSYLHPHYLHLCRHWISAVDEIILPRLRSKGGIIDMINLDNEISYIVRDGFLDSDYNPVNVRPGGFWHQFLTEKYGTAAQLPYATRYGNMDEVPAPRSVPEDMSGDVARHLDWVEFKEWVMCRFITEIRGMHVANGVEDVIFMTNFNPHLPEGVPTRMPSFEKAVKGNGRGIVGYDFYRGTFLSWSGYSSMARVLKLMNASLDYTWSAEFMAGTWNKALSARVSDDHMRFMARCALAQGCKSIAWFMFHDRMIWGDAPVSSHGHARPSLEVLRETKALCTETIPHWDTLVPQDDCAVVYDIAAHRHASVGDPAPCNDSVLHVGAPLVDGVKAGEGSREYTGIFRLVEAGGCQAGAVDIVARPERLDAYRLVFLPGGALVSAAAAQKLATWVRGGGALVVSGPWPKRDESGAAVSFLDMADPGEGEHRVGQGCIIRCGWLAEADPEEESLELIDKVQQWLAAKVGPAHVRIAPVARPSWDDWKSGGGVDNAGTKGGDELDRVQHFEEPRILASAVLQEGGGFPVVFVLNHYPEAVEFTLTFKTVRNGELRDLDSGAVIPIRNGTCVVDVDRKAGAVYGLEKA
ncbi:MAG: beta-galactosidase [Lentisphaerae bacterium]|nr:beta-galactosidase [Lentisphaerota bacterium]